MADENMYQGSGGVGSRQGRTCKRPLWVVYCGLGVRMAHQVGAAVVLASILLWQDRPIPSVYLYMAVVSGVALVWVEWLRHRQIYREVAGVATLVKCLCVGAALHGFLPAVPAMVGGFCVASVGAHLTKNIRHRLLF